MMEVFHRGYPGILQREWRTDREMDILPPSFPPLVSGKKKSGRLLQVSREVDLVVVLLVTGRNVLFLGKASRSGCSQRLWHQQVHILVAYVGKRSLKHL
jgi:hypothetical protein